MTVDRGGLDYNIQVNYDPTNLQQFRSDLQVTKAELKSLRSVNAGLASAMKDRKEAVEASAVAERKAAKIVGVRAKAEKEYAKAVERTAVNREKSRIAEERAFGLASKVSIQQQLRVKAEQDLSRILDKRAAIQQRVLAVQARGVQLTREELVAFGLASKINIKVKKTIDDITAAKARLAKQTNLANNAEVTEAKARLKAAQQLQNAQIKSRTNQLLGVDPAAQKRMDDLKKKTEEANKQSSILFRSLVRVFTIAAVFKAGSVLVSTIREAINLTVQFNDRIERAQIGISGIIASVGDIRDSSGQIVDTMTAFKLASAAAGKQVQQLRKDAINTTATFDQLVETFQIGIAPGLQAGLNLDEIRIFTRQISQFATSIGLAQDQLSEEIRSILGGTITRNTRIATALGLSNEDIKQAKEMGTLVQLLNKRFAAADIIGQKAATTFSGMVEKISDSIKAILGVGGEGFFNNFKFVLSDIGKALSKVNAETGEIELNPKLVESVKEVAAGFSSVVDEVRRLTDLFLGGDLVSGAKTLRQIIEQTGAILGGGIEGFVEGIKFIAELLPDIGIDKNNVRAIVKELVKLATIFFIGKQFFGLLKTPFTGLSSLIAQMPKIAAAWQSISTSTAVFGTSLAAALPVLTAIAAAAGSLFFAFDQIYQLVSGKEGVFNTFDSQFNRELAKAVNNIEGSMRKLGRLFVPGNTQGDLDNITNEINQRNQVLENERIAELKRKDFNKEIRNYISGQRKEIEEVFEQTQDFISKVPTFGPASDAIASRMTNALAMVKSQILPVFDQLQQEAAGLEKIPAGRVQELKNQLRDAAIEAKKALQSIEDTAVGVVLGPSEAADKIRDTFKDLQDKLREVSDETQAKLGAIGQSSAVQDIAGQGLSSRLAFERDLIPLLRERETVAKRIAANEAIVNSEEANNLFNTISSLRERVEAENRRAIGLQKQTDVDQFALVATIQARNEATAQLAEAEQRLSQISGQDAQKTIELLAQTEALKARLAELDRTADQFRARRLAIIAKEAEAKLNQLNFEKQIEVAQLRIEASAGRLNLAFALRNDQAGTALIFAQRELGLLRLQASEMEKMRGRDIAALQKELQILKQQEQVINRNTIGPAERNTALDGQIAALETTIALSQEEYDLKLQILQATIRIAEEEERRAKIKQDGNFGDQVELALTEMEEQLPNRFEQIRQTLETTVTGFADFISSAIIDAFDPTQKLDLRERFGRFLQGIAQEIIQTLVRIAAIKIALGLGSIFGFSEGGSVPEGFRHGGKVRRPREMPVRGYAGGGSVSGSPFPFGRPAWIDRRDTVPAWLQPKEFVHPVSAVQKYGEDLMEGLRSLSIDPTSVRAAAGLGPAPKASRAPRPAGGYASGGSVSASGIPSASAGPTPAFIIGNDQNAERFLAGGRNAFLRFMDENGYTRG